MAGTTYNTLNLAAVDEAPKATSTPRVAAVASVIAAVCVMFFAGRVHEGQTALYTHDEVLNVAQTCTENQYIGGCQACTTCNKFEFANGGCTFFKDTFCSYCEPIANCQRTNTECNTNKDSVCTQCDCNVPVAAWKHDGASCYFGSSCVACDICDKGQFQTTACTHDEDTQCQKCKTCPEGQYVKEACSYTSDTVCEDCVDCDLDTQDTLDQLCTGSKYNNQNDIFTAGSQTQCKKCTSWSTKDTFVKSACTKDVDAVIESCAKCPFGSYVQNEAGCTADNEGTFKTKTADRACTECTELLENGGIAGEGAPQYINRLCDQNGLEDFDSLECTVCAANEYIETACDLGSDNKVGEDTLCTVCDSVTFCDSDDFRCGATDGASTCTGCKDEMASFGNCCTNKNLGPRCDWEHMPGNCEADNKSFREREALRNGFTMTGSNEDFVMWCKKQCESFEDCTAFEVDADIVSGEAPVVDDTICSLKNQVIEDEHAGNENKNCFKRPQEAI